MIRKGRRGRLKRIEAEFVQATSNAFLYAYTSDLGYRAVAIHLRKIERVFVQRLQGKPRCALEVRRRIAEYLLKEAVRLKCSFRICRDRMQTLKALGFSSVETKSFHYFIYARAAMQGGHYRVALRTANEMTREWETVLRLGRNLVGREDLKLFKTLLSQLNDNRRES
jgi:hypothetical protein